MKIMESLWGTFEVNQLSRWGCIECAWALVWGAAMAARPMTVLGSRRSQAESEGIRLLWEKLLWKLGAAYWGSMSALEMAVAKVLGRWIAVLSKYVERQSG